MDHLKHVCGVIAAIFGIAYALLQAAVYLLQLMHNLPPYDPNHPPKPPVPDVRPDPKPWRPFHPRRDEGPQDIDPTHPPLMQAGPPAGQTGRWLNHGDY